MQGLKRQNEQLQKTIENCLQQIEKQKELNAQHETQIQTLLKFNERLLAIIQNELSTNRKERDSLQPISERSQRQSDLIIGPIQSFIKTRKLAPKSQRGAATTNSLVSPHNRNKIQNYGREMQSQLNHSSHDDHSDYRISVQHQTTSLFKQAVQASNQVKNEMQREIQELKEFKNRSNQFYDNKISEIKKLSGNLNRFKPSQQIKQINSKLNLSSKTANLLKNILNKS